MSKIEAFEWETVTMYVANGRTVRLGGVSYGPGAQVTLPAEEAAHLRGAGFLVAEPPILRPSAAERQPNPAGIGLQADKQVQGPNYTPT